MKYGMTEPLVTIVTPTFEHERFIGPCIESVRSQSYERWEMRVVDDGSSDRTAEIAESFNDSRIAVLRQSNVGLEGLATTYNRALHAGTGELVAILEGDDYWPPDKLSVQVPDFDSAEVAVSSGLFQIVDETGASIGLKPEPIPERQILDNDPVGCALFGLFDLRHLTFTWPVSTVVRRSALDRIGGFQQPPGLPIVDLPTMGRLAFEGRFAFHSEHVLGYWRRHLRSATKANLSRELTGVHRLLDDLVSNHAPKNLDVAQIDRLDNEWASFQVHRLVLLGRLLERVGRRADASTAFRRALAFRGGAKRKLKVAIGLAANRFRLNSERLYRRLGFAPVEQEVELATGDVTTDLSLFDEIPEPLDLVQSYESRRSRIESN